MPKLDRFRSFDIAQSRDGKVWELGRRGDSVVCVSFDTQRECFAELCAVGGVDVNDEDVNKVFNERAETMLALDDPSWGKLFDYGVDDSVYYYAYEVCDGERLGDYLFRAGSLEEGSFVQLASGMASGLAAVADSSVSLDEIPLEAARVAECRNGRLGVRFGCLPLCPAGDEYAPFIPIRGRQGITAILDLCDQHASGLGIWNEVVQLGSVADSLPEFADSLDVLASRAKGRAGTMPLGEFENAMFGRRSLDDLLAGDFKLLSRRPGQGPYLRDAESSDGEKVRLLLLPPDYWMDPGFLSIDERKLPAPAVPVRFLREAGDFRMVLEERFTSMPLSQVLRQPVKLEREDALLLLEKVHEALEVLEKKRIDIPDFRPENIYLCFDETGMEIDTDAVASQRPVTTWPPYDVRVRTHKTMAGLMCPPDADDPERARDILSKYLGYRELGMKDRATELLGGGGGSLSVSETLVTAKSILDPDEKAGFEDEPGEPEWNRVHEEQDFEAEDEEIPDEFDEEWELEEDPVFVSPIAAAMGTEVDEQDFRAPNLGEEESIFDHVVVDEPRTRSRVPFVLVTCLIGFVLAAVAIYKMGGLRTFLGG
ncbi:MAG: hypothetical protein AAGJ79_11760 [Verrucomicrobiota bacterium]